MHFEVSVAPRILPSPWSLMAKAMAELPNTPLREWRFSILKLSPKTLLVVPWTLADNCPNPFALNLLVDPIRAIPLNLPVHGSSLPKQANGRLRTPTQLPCTMASSWQTLRPLWSTEIRALPPKR